MKRSQKIATGALAVSLMALATLPSVAIADDTSKKITVEVSPAEVSQELFAIYRKIEGDEETIAIENTADGNVMAVSRSGKKWRTLAAEEAAQALATLKQTMPQPPQVGYLKEDSYIGLLAEENRGAEGASGEHHILIEVDEDMQGERRIKVHKISGDNEWVEEDDVAFKGTEKDPDAVESQGKSDEKNIVIIVEEDEEEGAGETKTITLSKTVRITTTNADGTDVDMDFPVPPSPPTPPTLESDDDSQIFVMKKGEDMSKIIVAEGGRQTMKSEYDWVDEDGTRTFASEVTGLDKEAAKQFIDELDNVPKRRKRALRSIL